MIRERMLHPLSPGATLVRPTQGQPGGEHKMEFFCVWCLRWRPYVNVMESHCLSCRCVASMHWAWDGDDDWRPMTLREVLSAYLYDVCEFGSFRPGEFVRMATDPSLPCFAVWEVKP